jgi:5-methyltetrahydropteroyltriglutamate--homocysteine methyltransferase
VIRAANHSSYPRVGEGSLDQQLRRAIRARDRGEAGPAEVAAVEDEVATLVLAEQSRAFVDVVTDGLVRWEGPVGQLARWLEGLEPGPPARWLDTPFFDRRPLAVGPIRRTTPLLAHAWEVASAMTRKPVKMVLPGPVTAARRCHDRRGAGLDALAGELAQALAAEVSDLVSRGCATFQVDEPLLCRHPEDVDLVITHTGRVLAAAGQGAVAILSTYGGHLGPLAHRLADLPGTHLGLDLVRRPGGLEWISTLPPDRGVALGLFDADSVADDDAADVVARLTPHREALAGRDVLVGPNAGLEGLPRDRAFDKLLHARYVVETLGKGWA